MAGVNIRYKNINLLRSYQKDKSNILHCPLFSIRSRSQAPAWECDCLRSSGFAWKKE
ncbi:hypothetical protein KsCSTR_32510 [Candidatus Kuenenia stuttgartiensis]|uniref:Uncharacterized protein n=1 Tax=Kuenenia stuttgartiensis TaxID=174633 RepID=Q1Q4M9_KUEST|nr:hypothetical protein KsCSTR_32510 [Candidatus Kuenenia stuttgartiensis]CAJ74976.1 unknown protein [Candidatus Kuenenia stuttgartiensis]